MYEQVNVDATLINALSENEKKEVPKMKVKEELTPELIQALKNKYKKIYKTTLIDGTEIVWRRYNRAEYKEIMKKYQDENDSDKRVWGREEECCRRCIVFPGEEQVNFILENMAGVATLLSDEIYEKSGFAFSKKTEEL